MPIELVAPDPLWPARFQEAKGALSAALGQYAVRIEHVGSTAIPGIKAKPVIDIAVAIEQYPLPDEVLSGVAALGYTYLGEYGISRRHLFFRRCNSVGYNVHINELANGEFQRHMLFRDYMRAHPRAAREYEKRKLELAARYNEVGLMQTARVSSYRAF